MFEVNEDQAERLRNALELTFEHMIECGVPPNLRARGTKAVTNELLKLFAEGHRFPNSPTEDLWRDRALKGYQHSR